MACRLLIVLFSTMLAASLAHTQEKPAAGQQVTAGLDKALAPLEVSTQPISRQVTDLLLKGFKTKLDLHRSRGKILWDGNMYREFNRYLRTSCGPHRY